MRSRRGPERAQRTPRLRSALPPRALLTSTLLTSTLLSCALLSAACWTDRAPPARPEAPAPSLAAVERPATPWPASARRTFAARAVDRCAIVVAHVFELSKQELSGRLPPLVLDELQLETIESCHVTEWSDELMSCYEETSSTAETTPCYRSMTEEQRNDFEKRFTEIMQRHHSAIHQTTPPPTP